MGFGDFCLGVERCLIKVFLLCLMVGMVVGLVKIGGFKRVLIKRVFSVEKSLKIGEKLEEIWKNWGKMEIF